MVIFAGQKYNYHQLALSFCFSSLQLTAGLDICYLLTDKAVIQESSAELDTSCFKSDGFSAQTCVLQPSPCMDKIHPHLPWLRPCSGTGQFASPPYAALCCAAAARCPSPPGHLCLSISGVRACRCRTRHIWENSRGLETKSFGCKK